MFCFQVCRTKISEHIHLWRPESVLWCQCAVLWMLFWNLCSAVQLISKKILVLSEVWWCFLSVCILSIHIVSLHIVCQSLFMIFWFFKFRQCFVWYFWNEHDNRQNNNNHNHVILSQTDDDECKCCVEWIPVNSYKFLTCQNLLQRIAECSHLDCINILNYEMNVQPETTSFVYFRRPWIQISFLGVHEDAWFVKITILKIKLVHHQ
jgi:hypothetical protein